MKRIVVVWQPVVGDACARWIARAHGWLLALILTIVVSWPIGVFHAVSTGALRQASGAANGLVFPLLLLEAILWAVALSHRRRRLATILSAGGAVLNNAPRVLSPSRFVRWVDAEGMTRSQVKQSLMDHFDSMSEGVC